MEKDEIYDLERGRGGMKYFHYWTAGCIRLKTKEAVFEAIKLKLIVFREDKITKKVEQFDYKTKRFNEVKK